MTLLNRHLRSLSPDGYPQGDGHSEEFDDAGPLCHRRRAGRRQRGLRDRRAVLGGGAGRGDRTAGGRRRVRARGELAGAHPGRRAGGPPRRRRAPARRPGAGHRRHHGRRTRRPAIWATRTPPPAPSPSPAAAATGSTIWCCATAPSGCGSATAGSRSSPTTGWSTCPAAGRTRWSWSRRCATGPAGSGWRAPAPRRRREALTGATPVRGAARDRAVHRRRDETGRLVRMRLGDPGQRRRAGTRGPAGAGARAGAATARCAGRRTTTRPRPGCPSNPVETGVTSCRCRWVA